jgi:pantetheine-phosphate adenylyltransferase
MTQAATQLAVFPGMFDPITLGHLDVIRRGADLFDQLIVAVGDNPSKNALLTQDQRAQLVREATKDFPNVRVETYTGLTIHLASTLGAKTILRGLRSSEDLAHELQMAQANRLAGDVETIYIATAAEHSLISSTLVRQIARGGGDISAMVPPVVVDTLKTLSMI